MFIGADGSLTKNVFLHYVMTYAWLF